MGVEEEEEDVTDSEREGVSNVPLRAEQTAPTGLGYGCGGGGRGRHRQ
jgi:hypothetical protein